MCVKWFLNLFHKPDPVVYPESNKILLTFAINDYPGTANDLNGCLNDQENVIAHLPEFQVRKFSDSEVTKDRFLDECYEAIVNADEGTTIVIHYSGHGTQVNDYNSDEEDGYDEALYLYNGSLIDDRINEILQAIPEGVTVLVLLDSCFSGSATRNPVRARFVQTESKRLLKRRKKALSTDIKWIVISGCDEDQTSADAIIDGRWNGAFTFWAMKTLDRSLTYKQWFAKIREHLPSLTFKQSPTLEGPDALINKQLFT